MIELFTVENLTALLSLTALEIVLGIDNIVFIAILSNNLPEEKRQRARIIGLGVAMATRILLLFSLVWLTKLTATLFTVFSFDVTGKGIILIVGGFFLIAKATHEIHAKLEGVDHNTKSAGKVATFGAVIAQIAIMDIIFSIDSVLTAIGMSSEIWVMVTAVIIAVFVMMLFARPVSNFVEKHPTLKMLALSFLVLIGVMLVAEGFGQHVNKGYIYSAMGFSLLVEMLNLFAKRRKGKTVQLNSSHLPESWDDDQPFDGDADDDKSPDESSS